MIEEERHSTHFDAQAIGEALGTRPATVHDIAYGEGQLFSTGHGAARLEVFSQTGVTRLTTQGMRVELFGNAISAVSEAGVTFVVAGQPDKQASLNVLPDGGVVFTFVASGECTPPTAAPHEEAPSHSRPPAKETGHGLKTAREPASNPVATPDSSACCRDA